MLKSEKLVFPSLCSPCIHPRMDLFGRWLKFRINKLKRSLSSLSRVEMREIWTVLTNKRGFKNVETKYNWENRTNEAGLSTERTWSCFKLDPDRAKLHAKLAASSRVR
jgi:hypothetical protein